MKIITNGLNTTMIHWNEGMWNTEGRGKLLVPVRILNWFNYAAPGGTAQQLIFASNHLIGSGTYGKRCFVPIGPTEPSFTLMSVKPVDCGYGWLKTCLSRGLLLSPGSQFPTDTISKP